MVGGGSRPGAKGGVRFGDPNRLFCIRPTMELSANEQPLLMLLVPSESVDNDDHVTRGRLLRQLPDSLGQPRLDPLP